MEDRQTDHDLLICIDVKLKELKNNFTNHLQHHFRYSIMAWGIAATSLLTAIGALITVLVALARGS